MNCDKLRQELHDTLVRYEERVKFNMAMSKFPGEEYEEYHIIAHVQQTIVDRLRYLLSESGETSTYPVQERAMENVKSLAGTGRTYCRFEIEVSGGAWGEPQEIALVETVGGGCSGTSTKLVKLTNFALPISGIPAGRYTLQAKVTGGGCGEPKEAHIQFRFPANTPKSVVAKGNRGYGWAFESKSPELLARLG